MQVKSFLTSNFYEKSADKVTFYQLFGSNLNYYLKLCPALLKSKTMPRGHLCASIQSYRNKAEFFFKREKNDNENSPITPSILRWL